MPSDILNNKWRLAFDLAATSLHNVGWLAGEHVGDLNGWRTCAHPLCRMNQRHELDAEEHEKETTQCHAS